MRFYANEDIIAERNLYFERLYQNYDYEGIDTNEQPWKQENTRYVKK